MKAVNLVLWQREFIIILGVLCTPHQILLGVAHGKSREREIAAALKAYELKVHPSGETHKLYRIKVVTAFMTAGVPLSKVEFFRPILEENAYRLCERRGLFDLVFSLLLDHSKTQA